MGKRGRQENVARKRMMAHLYYRGLSYRNIGKLFGIAEQTVSDCLSRYRIDHVRARANRKSPVHLKLFFSFLKVGAVAAKERGRVPDVGAYLYEFRSLMIQGRLRGMLELIDENQREAGQ